MQQARLMRSENDKLFAGVCGGIAQYLGVDSVFVRLAFLLLIFASGIGLLLYFILMLVMPSESNLNQPSSRVVQDNLEQLSDHMTSGIKRVRRHPQGPIIGAGLLIALGFYLLFENLGWLSWLSGDLFWPLAIIALGIYLIARNRR